MLRDRGSVAPGAALVFALEKLFFAVHWAVWISAHGSELGEMFAADPFTATFFAGYGAVDALFMGFFLGRAEGPPHERRRVARAGALPKKVVARGLSARTAFGELRPLRLAR